MKKRIILLVGIGFLALGIGIAIFHLISNSTRKITFEECEDAGGTAWWVDLYHPDICPGCAEYQDCQMEYNDYLEERNREYSVLREVCPMVVLCVECLNNNFPFPDKCPEGREKIELLSDSGFAASQAQELAELANENREAYDRFLQILIESAPDISNLGSSIHMLYIGRKIGTQ